MEVCGNVWFRISSVNVQGDKIYKTALKRFKPLEINGINLGFSESKHGAAFGEKLRRQVISDAFDIVKKSILYPEIFQLANTCYT